VLDCAIVEKRYQVVIVGGGPVGVGLAIALGRRGVTCAVIEKRTQLSAIPKGQGLAQRTMEHFWTWGVADDIRAARTMPEDHPIGQVTIYENLLSEFWHASPDRSVVQDFYFQRNERLPQYRTEEVLRRTMATLESVDAFWGATVTEVGQDADGVRVTFEKDGEHTVLTGDYVVGCDGAHSVVREQADIARHGTDWDELVALIVFRSRELHEARSSSSTPRCPPARRRRTSTRSRCRTAPPASTSRSRSTTWASGTCAYRSPTGTGPAGRSSPATPRTPTRPTAASASTTASRTP
jgi:2-polyprenyl-6-methoxyphenol hydroxylase-like FAD-dependent oxidoreductase